MIINPSSRSKSVPFRPRHHTHRRQTLYLLATSASLTLAASESLALDKFWSNDRGGTFSVAANWQGGSVAAATDIAHFGLSIPPIFEQATYTVSFLADTANQALLIEDDAVTFNLGTRAYTTTTAAGVDIGNQTSRTGRLTIINGRLNPTNIDIGAAAGCAGSLTISTGGEIIGSAPTINVGNLGNGSLTLQSGGLITLGTGGTLVLGQNSGVSGTATITGAGSSLTVRNLTVGSAGTGTLNLSSGGFLQTNAAASIASSGFGSVGTVNVSGNTSLWKCLATLTIGDGGAGALNISGGTVSGFDNVIGNAGSAASGTVTVGGASAFWNNAGTLTVGALASGTLNINSLGAVQNTSAVIGASSFGGVRGTGAVNVNGASAQWINSSTLTIGSAGHGSLNVTSGGAVSNTTATIAAASGSTSSATISGSVWTSTGSLVVGDAGRATLNVTGAGSISSVGATIASAASSTGSAIISGSSSLWTCANPLIIGGAGRANLDILAGGRVTTQVGATGYAARLADTAGSTATATVSGADSRLDAGGALIVGVAGNGTLNVSAAGRVTSGVSSFTDYVGYEGTGFANVSGNNSLWHSNATIAVGYAGTGTLNVSLGGRVESEAGAIGVAVTTGGRATGTATIEGGGTWANLGSLTVGDLGRGTLNVTAGGVVTATTAVVGAATGGFGFVNVTGTNSRLTTSFPLTVGLAGNGELHILDGGLVRCSDAVIASQTNGRAIVEVRGTGARWEISLALQIGANGVGTLDITDGGVVHQNGFAAVRNASVTVDGVGSRWNASNINVGSTVATPGSLTISDGALVETDAGGIGLGGAGQGVLLIEGPGSTWNVGGDFFASNGHIALNAGGVLNIGFPDVPTDGTGIFGLFPDSTLNLNGGEISFRTIEISGTTPTITFNSGTIRFTSDHRFDDFLLDTILTPSHTIRELQHLAVVGKPTLEAALTLDGGTFSAGSLLPGSPFFFNRGTFNLTSDPLTIGPAGLLGPTLSLSDRHVNVTNSTTIQPGARLILPNGSFSAGSLTNQGEILLQNPVSRISGGSLTNTGLLHGTGSVLNPVTNSSTGQIQVVSGQRLALGSSLANSASLSVIGGELQVSGATTNSASTGNISARDAILRFLGGLSNSGSLALSFGTSDIFGPITNNAGGRIVVTGQSNATFWGPVTNQPGSTFQVSAGSTAVFLSPVTGSGQFTGAGTKLFESGASSPSFLATTGHTIVDFPASLTTSFLTESSLTSYGPVTLLPNSSQSTLGSLDLDATGTLDLANNTLLLTNTPISLVRQYLHDNQLFSSTPDPTHTHSLGYIQTPSGILVKLTLTGDANLDGALTPDDFALLDRGLLTSGSLWQQGDFNYDGTITPTDYLLLDSTYAKQQGGPLSPSFLSQREYQFGPAYVSTLLTSIPEPTSLLAACGLALPSLLSRRPRKTTVRNV